ncbi:MAG: NADPH-dependent F420 reductase [Methanomicrobiaceae archaeon]|nr:NADPH-dependent F420 reductase [Methanomicrobiaceae archaeon]
MKIGIVGGTGGIGEGMALRLAPSHEVIIGSREVEKACSASECTLDTLKKEGVSGHCIGLCNQDAVDEGDIIVLAIPFRFVESTLEELTGFEEKVVVSPVNPIGKSEDFYYAPPGEGSAAQLIARLLPEASVVTAFNNIAANRWKDLADPLEYSVAVCSDEGAAKAEVMQFVASISKLRPFDAGPLAISSIVESITPLLLNLARLNRMKDVGIRFV